MKKSKYCLFIFVLMVFSIFSFNTINLQNVLAQDPSVTSITSTLNYIENDLEVQKNNGIYQINFEKNIQNPYKTYLVKTDITMSDFSIPTTEIIDQMTWTIKNLTTQQTDNISFSSSEYINEYYKLELHGKDISITPLKPCTIEVISTLQSQSSKITICCNYAVLERINIQNENSLTQLYESFSDIKLNVILEYADYLDPSISYNYIWKIGSQTLTDKSSSITITKDMIKIGETEISVEIENNQKISATIKLVITTNEDYVINITHSGNLVQTYDDHNQPISFTADVPITKDYQITWFLKSPDDHIYKKQSTQTNQKNYTFNPLQNPTGTYKIFAQATTIDNIVVTSEVYEIVINPKVVTEEKEFTIVTKTYSNASTNVQAFDCTIDTQNYYDEDEIVWLVNGSMYALGSHIKFEPSLAGEYIIQVRFINADNTLGNSISKTITLNAKTIGQNTLWIYISISLVVLIGLCVSSIIISNKMREKIW